MKPSSIRSTPRASSIAKLLGVGLATLTAACAFADQPVITARTTNTTFVLTACPAFCETSAAGTWSGSGSSSKSSATGDNAGGCTFAPGSITNGVPACSVRPTLATLGVYSVEVTHILGNASPNVIMSMSATGGTLSSNQTSGFDSAHGINVWYTNCFITNTSLTPTITFTYVSGTMAATGGRIYVDGFRFSLQNQPCAATPQITVVNGPLAAGQTFVNVPNVSTNATNVTVYSDTGSGSQTQIGSLAVSNVTSAVVPVTALVKGRFISATQTAAGQEGCPIAAGAGQLVGGGANNALGLGVCLDMVQDSSLTGPIGAAGSSSSSDFYFLGATGRTGGFATAPTGEIVITPSTCWQTVYINPVTANYFHWDTTTSSTADPNHFAELDAIALAIKAADTGPYEVYIDDFRNGPTTIMDFESPTNGTVGFGFSVPSVDSTPSGVLLAPSPGSVSPDVSVVTTNFASSGNKSLHVNWQFSSTANVNWLRLNAANHPQIDLTQPISFQILVLPVGATNSGTNVTINTQPANANPTFGQPATFSVVATGNSLSYQWLKNGAILSGATNSSYTTPNVTYGDVGTSYQVQVSDSILCPSFSSFATIATVLPLGTGTGLNGDYYTLHTNGVNNFGGVPTLSRVDPTVNFNFGTNSPASGVSTDFFTVRWTGQVQPLTTDTYTFYTKTDDGVRLWVNGQLLIDEWVIQSSVEWSASMALTGFQKYDVVMEYFDHTGGASASLSWSATGVPKAIIPQTQLYPATGSPGTAHPSLGTNFDGTNIHFNWSGSYSLQAATNILGPWTNYGGQSPVLAPINANPQQFFKLLSQ